MKKNRVKFALRTIPNKRTEFIFAKDWVHYDGREVLKIVNGHESEDSYNQYFRKEWLGRPGLYPKAYGHDYYQED